MTPLRYAALVSIALGFFCQPVQANGKFITFQVPDATATVPVTLTNNGKVIGFANAQSVQSGFIRAADGTFNFVGGYPVALARDGTVVGSYFDNFSNSWKGFIRSPGGQYSDVIAPHTRIYTSLTSLSNAGWVSGTGMHGSRRKNYFFGFLRDPEGHFTEFGTNLRVLCANSSNTTAGTLEANGFVRTPDGTITEIDPAGSAYTNATAINDAGTVTGWSDFSSPDTGVAFIRASDGTMSSFVVPGDNVQYTTPTGINKNGVIAGIAQNKDGSQDGFIRALDGTITMIDVPGGTNTEIASINDKGEVAGEFTTNGIIMGFIWKP